MGSFLVELECTAPSMVQLHSLFDSFGGDMYIIQLIVSTSSSLPFLFYRSMHVLFL